MRRRVVLIPGLLCTGEVFSHAAAALARGCPATAARAAVEPSDVIVADVKEGGWTTMEGLAEQILRTAGGDGPLSVAGLSMGGYAALAMARMAPERVEAVALISSQARADSAQTRRRRDSLVAMAREHGNLDAVMELQGPMLLAPGAYSHA